MTSEPLRLPANKTSQTPKMPPLEMEEPFNREAEEMLIGILLGYPERLGETLGVLTTGARDFRVDRMREIFAAIQALDAEGQGVDAVTIANKLAGSGGDFTATWAELMALEQCAPPPGMAHDYARIIADKARRRRDIHLARALVHDAYLEADEAAYAVTRASFAEGIAYDKAQGAISRFKARALSDLRNREHAPMLDPELHLRTDSLALIYAKENVGKSAYILYRMARLASEGKHVYYVCGEGLSGVIDRLDGIIAAHHLNSETLERCFHIVEESPQFMAREEIRELITEAQLLDDPIALIVFDTLATATEGQNENAPEVMSAVTGGMRRIMRELNCAGILIHHSGKDTTRGARGHSSLGGAVDLRIEVTGEEGSDLITLHCDKERYGARGWKLYYQLRGITLDDYGDHTAVVAFPTDERPTPVDASGIKLTRNDRKMLAVLRSLTCGMRYGAWIAQAQEMEQIPASSAKDAIRRLVDAGLVAQYDGMYQPTSLADTL